MTVEPSVADRIRELVLHAATGSMTVEQKGRLELLLITYRTRELGLDDVDPAEALMRLRQDQRAGEIIRTVELWLHAPEGVSTPSQDTVQELIARCVPEARMSTPAGAMS